MKFSKSLKLNHIFQRLYRTNGFANGYLVLYARKNREETNRLGITVGKKLGKAHIRNRARRRLREVYRLNEDRFTPGWDIVLVARSRTVDADFSKLTAALLQLAEKAGLLKNAVIANQSADWCGNPSKKTTTPKDPGDSHAGVTIGSE